MINLKPLTILVVDDVTNMRRMLKNMLRHMGAEHILEASDGPQAVEQLTRETVDLVLCDWNMPQMKGIEVLKFVRDKKEIENMPFIMVTAEVSEDVIAEAAETEVDDYLVKPFTLQQLGDKISRVLAKEEEVSDIDLHLARGRSYVITKQFEKAAQEFKTALAKNPNSPRTLHAFGQLYEEQGNDRQAEKMYLQAHKIAPKYLKATDALANLYQALGDQENHIKFTQKSVGISPRNMDRRFLLGQALVTAGRPDEAKKLFGEILSVASAQFAEIAEKVGEALLAMGAADEAEKAFAKALDINPKNLHIFNRLGIAFRQQQKYAEAIANYKRALTVSPNNPTILYNLARAHFETGDLNSAMSTLAATLKANPGFEEAKELLAAIKQKAGKA